MGIISESQVSLSDVKTTFGGGSPPNNLTAYYSGSGTETDPSTLAYPPLNVVGLSGFVPSSGTIQLTDYLGATKANIVADTYQALSNVIGGTGETVTADLTFQNDGQLVFEDVYNDITTFVPSNWTLGPPSSINMNTYFRFVFNVTSASVSTIGGSITIAGTPVSTGFTGNISGNVPSTVLVQTTRGTSAQGTSTTTVTFNLLVIRRDTSATVVQKQITVEAVANNSAPE